MNEIVKFAGSEIQTVEVDGELFVAMKPIVEGMGLDWRSQQRMIENDLLLNRTKVVTTLVAGDGKNREVLCLPLKYLNGYLFKINAKRYSGDRQNTILKYQEECYDVLFNYWNNGGAINHRASVEQIQVLENHIQTLHHEGIEKDRIIAIQSADIEYFEKVDTIFGNKTTFGEIAKNGNPRVKPRRATLVAPSKKDKTVTITTDALQLLLDLNKS